MRGGIRNGGVAAVIAVAMVLAGGLVFAQLARADKTGRPCK